MSSTFPAKSNIEQFEKMYSKPDNGEQSGQGSLEMLLQPMIEIFEMVSTAAIYMTEQISDLVNQPAGKA